MRDFPRSLAARERLAALGRAHALDRDEERWVVAYAKYNEALALEGKKKHAEAVAAFEACVEADADWDATAWFRRVT